MTGDPVNYSALEDETWQGVCERLLGKMCIEESLEDGQETIRRIADLSDA